MNPGKTFQRINTIFVLIALLLFSCVSLGKETAGPQKPIKKTNKQNSDKSDSADQPPNIGLFSLPPSQMPGPLVSFGQTLIYKGQEQVFLTLANFSGKRTHFATAIPYFAWGIRDDLTFSAAWPVAVSYQIDNDRSSGLGDATFQLEYGFYNKSTSTYIDLATVVGAMTLPSGSVEINPTTGFGAPSFFIGETFSRTYIDWYLFTSEGALITTPNNNNTKLGNQYFYQFGLGRLIANVDQWLLAWLIEADGLFSDQDKDEGVNDPDSGGNLVLVTPSLFASNKSVILQLGAGYYVSQHLYGQQNRMNYLAIFSFGYTFN